MSIAIQLFCGQEDIKEGHDDLCCDQGMTLMECGKAVWVFREFQKGGSNCSSVQLPGWGSSHLTFSPIIRPERSLNFLCGFSSDRRRRVLDELLCDFNEDLFR